MDEATTASFTSFLKGHKRMKRVLLFTVAIGIAGTWVGTTPVFGGQATYPVCHINARSGVDWQLVYVSYAGLQNHLNGSHEGFDYVPDDEFSPDACNGTDPGPGW
jgi:hypothetical protein